MKVLFSALMLAAFALAHADSDIPLNELSFVDRAPMAGKAALIEQLGEPSRAYVITDRQTGEVVASIWHYHYINTSEEGEYYKTTELDFIGDRIVNIVCAN